MKEKRVPVRRCIGCMTSKPKTDCIRICRTPEGEIKADVTGKQNGRGAYLCKDMACFEKMAKGHKLSREFEMQIPESVYAELRIELESIISASGGGNIE
ncbi:MAG: YlxR family protein [Clostridia bacterium]|nr:YlxR family protein [Clostridia bacterium]